MIKIQPYYERTDGQEILELYLNLVADVVPFLSEDVLDEVPKDKNSISDIPRKRTQEYKALLIEYGIPVGGTPKERRVCDAELAEKLIEEYSKELHEQMYKDTKGMGGKVNRAFLRHLLTVRFLHGDIPDELELKDKKSPGHKATKNLREYVFRYDAFSKRKITKKKNVQNNQRDIFQFVSMLGVEVCPYCNRQFTSTIVTEDRQIRPQLDHFRNKEAYPYLALSINNLIPSCAVCNLLKHNKNDKMIYPYDEGVDDNYIFWAELDEDDIVTPLTGAKEAPLKIEVKFGKKDKKLKNDFTDRADRSITILSLEEIYKSHNSYVADLFRQRYIFTELFFSDMKNQFPELFQTEEDVKHLVYLMDYSPDKWGERPLAKLTHDIVEQIDKLYFEETTDNQIRSSSVEKDKSSEI